MASTRIDTTIDKVKMMRQVTLYARITRATEWQWRMWLGARLMFFAAWVMNCNLEIEGRGR